VKRLQTELSADTAACERMEQARTALEAQVEKIEQDMDNALRTAERQQEVHGENPGWPPNKLLPSC
jgi:multidrug resistance efflux pump